MGDRWRWGDELLHTTVVGDGRRVWFHVGFISEAPSTIAVRLAAKVAGAKPTRAGAVVHRASAINTLFGFSPV
jgi:hypothetical protein